MEMLCPECMGPLVTRDGKTATCTLHGGEFRILYMRGLVVTSPPAPTSVSETTTGTRLEPAAEQVNNPYRAPAELTQTCVRHPGVTTGVNCAACDAGICQTCSFPQPDGSQLCPDCVGKARVVPPSWREVPEGVMCTRHPEVQAERYCKSCRKAVCATCDFALPGGVHVCPDCATKPNRALSSKRKTLIGWAYVLAIWCTVWLGLLVGGAFAEVVTDAESAEAFGLFLSLVLFIPSLIGVALAFSALDRRLANPPVVWVAVIWNGLALTVYVLLNIIGLMIMAA